MKQGKAQIQSLEIQIQYLTQNRGIFVVNLLDDITLQLMELEKENDVLRVHSENTTLLKVELAQLNEKYNTLLELVGEKEEVIMELQQDIQDMREAFKKSILVC